jgi:hypothetical protein
MMRKDRRRRTVAGLVGCVWLAAAAAVLPACGGSLRSQPLASRAAALDEIAAIVVDSPLRSSNYVGASRLGAGQVIVGDRYFSALGIPCQRATFVSPGGEGYDLAVCAEKNGEWATAPEIFMASTKPGTME